MTYQATSPQSQEPTSTNPQPPAPAPETPAPETPTALRITLLAATFVLVHAFCLILILGKFNPWSLDVDLYRQWFEQGQATGQWVGLQRDWVYPAGALVPIFLAGLAQGAAGYMVAWFALVTLLNAAVCVVVTAVCGVRRATGPLVWWLVFLAVLVPVSTMRLDAVTSPLVILALLFAATPSIAAILITIGAWIKVSPGALIFAFFAVVRRRWSQVILPAATTCAAVILAAFFAGARPQALLGFLTEQDDRGLQFESVLATPILWFNTITHAPTWTYNERLATVEVAGAIAPQIARFADLLLLALTVTTTILIYRARHNGTDAILTGSLALIAASIVGNKVGSPQFIAWLAPPILVALARGRALTPWIYWAAGLLGIAALTLMIYPLGYSTLLGGNLGMLVILTLRNAAVVTLMILAMTQVGRLGHTARGPTAREGTP
jgi:hypothetical protein